MTTSHGKLTSSENRRDLFVLKQMSMEEGNGDACFWYSKTTPVLQDTIQACYRTVQLIDQNRSKLPDFVQKLLVLPLYTSLFFLSLHWLFCTCLLFLF